jgi:hypothetical protein
MLDEGVDPLGGHAGHAHAEKLTHGGTEHFGVERRDRSQLLVRPDHLRHQRIADRRRVRLKALGHHAAPEIGLQGVAVLDGLRFRFERGEVGAVEQLVLDAELEAAVSLLNVLRHVQKRTRKAG